MIRDGQTVAVDYDSGADKLVFEGRSTPTPEPEPTPA
jgi:hypothetical protein